MRRPLLLAAAALAAALLSPASPAGAITDGTPDAGAHPFVGLMVAQDADGGLLWNCSGSLISPTLFLTAGHCTEAPAAHVEIWFDEGHVPLGAGFPAAGEDPCAGVVGYPCTGDVSGTPSTHPQFDPADFTRYDLGMVELDEPVAMPAYAELPELDQLDALKPSRHTTFTTVGYGLQASYPDAASWKNQARRVRLVAQPHLVQINNNAVGDYSFLTSANANTGGQCAGDSGGPVFIGDSTVLAGVVSYGKNGNCAGQGGVYRVDRADDLGFIATFTG